MGEKKKNKRTKKNLRAWGRLGGLATGPSKARPSEAMRRAALKRWDNERRRDDDERNKKPADPADSSGRACASPEGGIVERAVAVGEYMKRKGATPL